MNTVLINELLTPVWLTLRIALLSTLIAFVSGSLFAGILAGKKGLPSVMGELLISIPIFLPPTVLGFYLLTILGKQGVMGGFFHKYLDISLLFTPFAAVIAASLAAMPIIYKGVRSFLESVNPEITGAARIDGANRLQILFFISLPLSAKGILAGIMLAFLRGLGEFGITVMIAGNIPGRTQTLSLAIYDAVMIGDISKANILAAFMGIISLVILVLLLLIDQKTANN